MFSIDSKAAGIKVSIEAAGIDGQLSVANTMFELIPRLEVVTAGSVSIPGPLASRFSSWSAAFCSALVSNASDLIPSMGLMP